MTVDDARSSENPETQHQLRKFAKLAGKTMKDSVFHLKGGEQDISGTIKAGLEILLAEQGSTLEDTRETAIASVFRRSIHANLSSKSKKQANSVVSLAAAILPETWSNKFDHITYEDRS